jgi:hypothetical protein
MRTVRVALALFTLSIVTGTSYADVMAQGKITRLDSSNSAAGSFVMEVEGPGGYVCNGSPQMIAAGNFPDSDSFKRFVALAMLAFTRGSTVVVYNNPVSASCPYLAFISVLAQ